MNQDSPTNTFVPSSSSAFVALCLSALLYTTLSSYQPIGVLSGFHLCVNVYLL